MTHDPDTLDHVCTCTTLIDDDGCMMLVGDHEACAATADDDCGADLDDHDDGSCDGYDDDGDMSGDYDLDHLTIGEFE